MVPNEGREFIFVNFIIWGGTKASIILAWEAGIPGNFMGIVKFTLNKVVDAFKAKGEVEQGFLDVTVEVAIMLGGTWKTVWAAEEAGKDVSLIRSTNMTRYIYSSC